MKDVTILRMLDEARKSLKDVNFPAKTPHLLPSYNALLMAAKANHPEDVFLGALEPLGVVNSEGKRERMECGPEEMRVLFGQMYICLEGLLEEAEGEFVAAGPERRGEWRGGEPPTERM